MVIITARHRSFSQFHDRAGSDDGRVFCQTVPGTPVILSVLLGMGLGSLLGTFNGLIISRGNVPPIIATLGTLSIYRGLVLFLQSGDLDQLL